VQLGRTVLGGVPRPFAVIYRNFHEIVLARYTSRNVDGGAHRQAKTRRTGPGSFNTPIPNINN
jgi:hypothetical protein